MSSRCARVRGLAGLAAIVVALTLTGAPVHARRLPPERTPPAHGVIAGVVRHHESMDPIADAQVRLYCQCLRFALSTTTDEQGRYRFVRLPPGAYTVDSRVELALFAKRFRLPRNAKFRVNFWLDPQDDRPRLVDLEPVPRTPAPAPASAARPQDWVPGRVREEQRAHMPAAFRHLEHVEWTIPLRAY